MTPKLSRFDTLIFDFDGTLTKILPIDWTQLKKEIDQICEQEGVNSEAEPYLSGKLNLAFSYSGRLRNKIMKLIILHEKSILNKVRVNRKILNVLRRSLKKGQEVYILSNNTSYLIKYFLSSYKISMNKKNILSLDQNFFAKPHITILRTLSKYCKAKKVIYIGNSPVDKQLAGQLGFYYTNIADVN